MRTLFHFAEDGDSSGFFPALAKYHDRKKYRMVFATLKPIERRLKEFMEEQSVETYSCGARSRMSYPLALVRLTMKLRSSKCDIFHAHLFDPSVVGLLAARAAGVPAKILTRHYSNYHTRINRPWHVRLDKMCTSLSDAVIAVSNETAEHLIRVEGAPSEKVSTIHNGIDFDRVKSSPGARDRVRADLGLGDTFTFLIAARLHPEKGYDHLFEAVRLLKNRSVPPFVLLVAGDGALSDFYIRMVKSLGIENHVRFLGFRSDAPDLMMAADVFVLPSLAEAFGLVLAEALLLGRPILATRVGGIPEIIDDGIDGCLVPPADPASLAQAMESFADGTIHLPGQGERAAGKVRERFDFRSMLRRYEAVYDRACGPA